MTAVASPLARARSPVIDKLGVLIALIVAAAWVFLPFATFKANRIVQGQSRIVFDALPLWEAVLLAAIVAVSLPVIFYRTPTLWRLLDKAAWRSRHCSSSSGRRRRSSRRPATRWPASRPVPASGC